MEVVEMTHAVMRGAMEEEVGERGGEGGVVGARKKFEGGVGKGPAMQRANAKRPRPIAGATACNQLLC
jgi:hypothetical protein